MGDASDSTLLPPEFRSALGLGDGEVPERTAVQLGEDGLQAYRYEDLQLEDGARRATVYVAPTSAGVATVACLAPPADAGAFKPECDGIANTLRLGGDATPFPVGPNAAYAKTLGTTFAGLERGVARGERALRRDGATFRQQAAAAREIQGAYAAAAKRLRRADLSPADRAINAALVKRLAAVAAAWKQAAGEAADKDKRGFARSERGIRRAQQQLAQTVAGLEAAGYSIAG
jgi:hypothetical protein